MKNIIQNVFEMPIVKRVGEKVLGLVVISLITIGVGTVMEGAATGVMDTIKEMNKEEKPE